MKNKNYVYDQSACKFDYVKKMTKQQEFDLIFKYPELGFTQDNLYDIRRWQSIYPYFYYGDTYMIRKEYVDRNEFVREFKDYIN